MVGAIDEFLNYVEKVDGRLKCMFCGFVFSGMTSIWGFKCHLSGVEGQGVNVCEQVPPGVKEKACEAIPNPTKRRNTMPSSSCIGATNTVLTSSREQTNEVENGARGGEMVQEDFSDWTEMIDELTNIVLNFSQLQTNEVETTEKEMGVGRSYSVAEFRSREAITSSPAEEAWIQHTMGVLMRELSLVDSRELEVSREMQPDETSVPGGSSNGESFTVPSSSQDHTNEGENEVIDVGMAQTDARSMEQEMGEGVEEENWNKSMTDDSMQPIERGSSPKGPVGVLMRESEVPSSEEEMVDGRELEVSREMQPDKTSLPGGSSNEERYTVPFLSNLVCLLLSSPLGARHRPAIEIPRGLISKLLSLELLVIDLAMCNVWLDGNIIDEVASLRRLTKILLHFPKDEQLKRFLSSSLPWQKQSISTFHFSVGGFESFTSSDFIMPYGSSLEYRGCHCGCSTIPHVIIDVQSHSQNFVLKGDHVMKRLSEYGLGNLKGLKKCDISFCASIEILANEEELVEEDVLPNVEDLMLSSLLKLRNIVEGGHVSHRSFGNLKNLELWKCNNLKYIFSWSMIKQLSNLETLDVSLCKQLEDIFEKENKIIEEDSSQLPNLKILKLEIVPKLISIDRIATLALSSIEEIIFKGTICVKSLPNSLLSAPELRQIESKRRWWEQGLKWENDAIKQQFQPLFKVCVHEWV